MVEEADALASILAAAAPLETVEVALQEALGLFLAAPIRSRLAHPAFANAVVDGYAIRVADDVSSRPIVGEQPAGRNRGLSLNPGEAIRIFTGAPIPAGCDGVVMQEDSTVEEGRLFLRETIEPGENIRRAGADLAVGQLIGEIGDCVTPQLIGLLASQGFRSVAVRRRPRVTVLTTGDELRPPGSELQDGEIYDSNGAMLGALLQTLGIGAVVRHSPDDLRQTQEEISRALEASDVVVVSGGVSVGDHDHVKPALAALGIALDLWRIRMKPGKPLAFAQSAGKLIFGLPGNPVASFVTFLVLLRPALRQMVGARNEALFLDERVAQIESEMENRGDRPHYLRGTFRGGRFISKGLQESHALFGLSQSNALLRLAPGEKLAPGDRKSVAIW